MGEDGFPYQHVECVMPDGTLLGAHLDGGVMARPADYDAGKYQSDLRVSIPATAAQEAAFYAFLRAQLGKPYDLQEIGSIIVGVVTGSAPDWTQTLSWICSELQTKAALAAGVIKSAVADSTPRDCLVWCGALTAIDSGR